MPYIGYWVRECDALATERVVVSPSYVAIYKTRPIGDRGIFPARLYQVGDDQRAAYYNGTGSYLQTFVLRSG